MTLRHLALVLWLASACGTVGQPPSPVVVEYRGPGQGTPFHSSLTLDAFGGFSMIQGCWRLGGRFHTVENQVLLEFNSGRRQTLTVEPTGALVDSAVRFEPVAGP
jgi:hypothetical protein